ncbi:DUF6678 family protein [Novosphingobium sp.]|uniref:DUF6678 family protein n=1 Tax=Novosphingobium sp. TaxID=1874826 RepID=UPI001D4A9781|nr:DUF6678 family protein [Novosphingobium sp.]MBX9665401.1 hypothetical protein [Novosphingobium sp.]
MTVHSRQDLERLGRLARARYSHALMSDTKWRKLFSAVDEAGLSPKRIVAKFIDRQHVSQMKWPGDLAMWPPHPWIDTFALGPIELRSIEWILIPSLFHEERGARGVPPREVRQDFEAIGLLLESLGQFPLEVSAEGLRIIGYK